LIEINAQIFSTIMLRTKFNVRRQVMNSNIGNFDRAIRIVLGAALIGYALLAKDRPYSSFGWIGIIPILTAFVSFCPIYSLLGVRTNSGK
jgi:Protein of unknown function (DUF2892)